MDDLKFLLLRFVEVGNLKYLGEPKIRLGLRIGGGGLVLYFSLKIKNQRIPSIPSISSIPSIPSIPSIQNILVRG